MLIAKLPATFRKLMWFSVLFENYVCMHGVYGAVADSRNAAHWIFVLFSRKLFCNSFLVIQVATGGFQMIVLEKMLPLSTSMNWGIVLMRKPYHNHKGTNIEENDKDRL